jgi:hypothetical protein
MQILRWSLSIMATMCVAGTTAMAQTAANPALQAACRADVQRLCAGVQPGGGRIAQCLKAHVNEVSPGCLEAARASRQGAQAPVPR